MMNNFQFNYQGDNAPKKDKDIEYGLDHIFGSGDYAGKTLQDRIDTDPDSVHWLIENYDFQLDNEAYSYLLGETEEVISSVEPIINFLGGSVLTLTIDDELDKEEKIQRAKDEAFAKECREQILETDHIIWGLANATG